MRTLVTFIGLSCLLLCGTAAGQDAKLIDEKASFLIGLVDHVTWSSGGPGANDTVRMFIVGESPVAAKVKEKEKAGTHPIRVTAVTTNDELSGAHIVFVASDKIPELAKVLKKTNGTKAVTVADAKDFARFGVMLNLAGDTANSALKLEVNKMVMDMEGVKLDDKLLKDAIKI